MDKGSSDIRVSFERAKSALANIVREKHSALPRSYAVWYAYAQGVPVELVSQIDACRAAVGTVSEDECALAYDRFVAPVRENDIDKLFTNLIDQLEHLVCSIDHSENGVRRFSQELSDAAENIDRDSSSESLRSVLARLSSISQSAQARHTALNTLLDASRREVETSRTALTIIRTQSYIDGLTGLSNRRHFEKALREEFEKDTRPLSMVMFDIDHFKRFNDTYGHLTGDHVLKLVASILKQCASGRIVGRYGGEEFAVVCPGDTRDAAVALADRTRTLVMAQKLKKKSTGDDLGRVTLSAGVSQLKVGDTLQSFVARADERLYVAKHAGRNRVLSD